MENLKNNAKPSKPKFYIFLGIEKTIVTKDWIDKYANGRQVYGDILPDPACMHTLNCLIDGLEEKFDVRLVITSKRREYPHQCEQYLKRGGLQYNKPMFFTRFVEGARGEKIVDFLDSQGASPLTYHTAPFYVRFLKNLKDNPDFKNYVVIQNGHPFMSKYIPKSQIKKVGYRQGLTQDIADKILEANGCSPTLESVIIKP